MKILSVLTYYRPHTSGLTIYAERLARAFAKRGHQVTVMTTHYDPSLPREETMDGAKVIRVPVAARVSKGVLAPTFGLVATKLVSEHDVIQLHLPQFDAPGVALRGRLFGKPSVLTYHCDLLLPPGSFNRFVNTVVNFQNNTAGLLANHIVTYTQDYADHSPYLSRFASVVEILLEALPTIFGKYPNAQVLFAGQYQNVMGEQVYYDRLSPQIREYEISGHWTFLGNLDPVQLAALYPNLDVLTVPSLNSTEAFGLVQIEAMMNGVPCVASALPGVRQPVKMHGMGRVAKIGDPASLAEAILEVLNEPQKFKGDVESIKKSYNPDSIAAEYERLFEKLMRKK